MRRVFLRTMETRVQITWTIRTSSHAKAQVMKTPPSKTKVSNLSDERLVFVSRQSINQSDSQSVLAAFKKFALAVISFFFFMFDAPTPIFCFLEKDKEGNGEEHNDTFGQKVDGGNVNIISTADQNLNKDEKKNAKLKKDTDNEPMPLIKSGVSIAADMRFGWKP